MSALSGDLKDAGGQCLSPLFQLGDVACVSPDTYNVLHFSGME